MYRKMNWLSAGVLGLAMFLAACGNAQKEATEAALNAAQAAVTAAQGEAAKYVPDQLKAAQGAIASAKEALAKGDYQAALTAAQDAASKAKDLAAAAAAKKEELTKSWGSISEAMPHSLETVKAKLDAYTKHAPAGFDKSKLADAKAEYDQLKSAWADASAAYTQGNLADAASKASSAKELLAKLMELLGIKS